MVEATFNDVLDNTRVGIDQWLGSRQQADNTIKGLHEGQNMDIMLVSSRPSKQILDFRSQH